MSVSREETQARINLFGAAYRAPFPNPSWSVIDALEILAAEHPERPCLICEDKTINYGELDALAGRYASLALESGLRPGDVGAVMLENRLEFFAVWMGLAKIGVIAALLNTQARHRALDHAIRESGGKLLFLGAECLDQYRQTESAATLKTLVIPDDGDLPQISSPMQDIQIRLAKMAPLANAADYRGAVRSEQPCFYVFTSGTTGLPKAAPISHRRFLSVGRAWKAIAGLTHDDVFYCVLPLFHGAALMSLYSSAIAAGGPTVVRRKFSVSRFWTDVNTHRVTVFQYVGEVCRYLINAPVREGESLHSLKILLGSGLGIDVWTEFTRRFGSHLQIFEGWGATESNGNLTNFDNKPGSCGRIPFRELTHVRLVRFDTETEDHPRGEDGWFIECGKDEVGEIICQIAKGDGTLISPFEGYTNTEETNKKILRNVFERGDLWWRSGDLLRKDNDDYFYFVDRIGDTFRWKAENVSTTEVMQQLASAYPQVALINVYGVAVPGHIGQAGMVALIMKPDQNFDGARMYVIATAELPHYAVPLFIRVGAQADLTATFKLKKVELRAQGFDPRLVNEPLYVLSHRQRSYVPFSDAALAELDISVKDTDKGGR